MVKIEMNHMNTTDKNSSTNCNKKQMLLYAITDRSWLNGETLYSQVEKALKGGATFLQLREKTVSDEEIVKQAKELKPLCEKYNVPLIINDSVEIALKTGADGVHVGQSDMEVRQAREKLGPDKIIGVSAHNVEEALEAERNGADYLGVGAVFVTDTKGDAKAIDHQIVRDICNAVNIPVVAIGGISETNVMQLKGTGINGVAVISALFAKEDITKATSDLKEMVEQIVQQ